MNAEKLKILFEKSKDKYADSKLIGTTYQTMYNIIYKDSICKVDLLEKIAKFYKVPVGYFFDEEKSDNNENDLLNELDSLKQEVERLNKIIANGNNGQSYVLVAVPVDSDSGEYIDLRDTKNISLKILRR
jgi:transcriptional regulator with XRE-family HTH domain